MILQIFAYAHSLKLILSAFSITALQIAYNLGRQRDEQHLLQSEAKSSQNQDLVDILGNFGSDFAGLKLFDHCIDSAFQHRFLHVLVEICRFRIVLWTP